MMAQIQPDHLKNLGSGPALEAVVDTGHMQKQS